MGRRSQGYVGKGIREVRVRKSGECVTRAEERRAAKSSMLRGKDECRKDQHITDPWRERAGSSPGGASTFLRQPCCLEEIRHQCRTEPSQLLFPVPKQRTSACRARGEGQEAAMHLQRG